MIVYMRNITLSAEEDLIKQARSVARSQKSTLNQLFRNWLAELASQSDREKRIRELDLRLSYVNAGQKFSRDQMNELFPSSK